MNIVLVSAEGHVVCPGLRLATARGENPAAIAQEKCESLLAQCER